MAAPLGTSFATDSRYAGFCPSTLGASLPVTDAQPATANAATPSTILIPGSVIAKGEWPNDNGASRPCP
jgi:hypothetical protein